MKYFIDLPGHLVQEIRKVLEKGDYNTINEFILTALENQIAMEDSEITEEDLFSSTVRIPKKVSKQKENNKLIDFKDLLSVSNLSDIEFCEYPNKSDLQYPGTDYEKSWLWGQINRIFPVKLAARILLKMQNEKNNSVRLEEYINYSCEIASKFGYELSKINNKLKRSRDEKTDVALPLEGKIKSIDRYKNHFLIYQRKTDKILDGALGRMKFANINANGFVRLTEEGYKFAKMWNPIIDDDLSNPNTLSKGEKELYLNHIKTRVPEERNPIYTLKKIISEGNQSLNEIDNEIKKIKPEWSDTVVVTQRAGSFGRMYELDLVRKTKDGVNVKYFFKGDI
ncbi:hypothetical protein D4R71_07670 [bacterium]|nr:MAG: hypothetical protein D4R71_07670 [bacterium]